LPNFEQGLIARAAADRRHIVLPEGSDDRILQAAAILLGRGAVAITVLGKEEAIRARCRSLGVNLGAATIVDPLSSPWRNEFITTFVDLRAARGLTRAAAAGQLDGNHFGALMVHSGRADGMVSGAVHTTAETLRPALQVIGTADGVSLVSSVFFLCLEPEVLVYGDCAVIPNPDAAQLAEIAVGSALTARAFGIEPRVALLSYSTGDSGSGEDVERVREAARRASRLRPDLAIDGPLQYDAAVDAEVAALKAPDSPVAGRATVFVFPDLNAGNIAYKAVQRATGAVAIGPVLQGLRLPVNDLSRGCSVRDIVNTVAATAVQAQAGAQS